MKHPFKFSKTNIIFASIVSLIILFFNRRFYGFDAFTFSLIIGKIFATILFPTLLALLFWFLLGRKENGGNTTFNIVLTLMLLSTIGEFSRMAKNRQKPIEDIQNAITEYKENSLIFPDSTNLNYSVLSKDIKNAIDDLIKTSVGEEKNVYLILKSYFKKSDSVNINWNNAYNSFNDPRILDFTQLNNHEEYEFQRIVIQDYIDKSENFKTFVQNRFVYIETQANYIDKNNKAYKGFIKGLTYKDSIQRPIFIPYINAHIEFGKEIKGIVNLLEQENGKWKYEDEMITFKNSESQKKYNLLLNDAILNEEIVNELVDKLIEIM